MFEGFLAPVSPGPDCISAPTPSMQASYTPSRVASFVILCVRRKAAALRHAVEKCSIIEKKAFNNRSDSTSNFQQYPQIVRRIVKSSAVLFCIA